MVVHNGIIENCAELKRWLEEKHAYTFVSQTDTEVIVALLSVANADAHACSTTTTTTTTTERIRWTLRRLVGTYGIVVMDREDADTLYCVRSGSPLLVGATDDLCIVTSEQSGFHNQIHTYITLENDDICVISKSQVHAQADGRIRVKTGCMYQEKPVFCVERLTSPAPYDHWTIREIHEQPATILNALNHGGRIMNELCVKLGGLDQHVDMLWVSIWCCLVRPAMRVPTVRGCLKRCFTRCRYLTVPKHHT